MELVIVTGMSGTGKTRAINALEDIGFFCVDNIPPKLILTFADLCNQSAAAMKRVAIVVDARSKEMFGDLSKELDELDRRGQPYRILYLDADDKVILRRYQETRRRHPLLDCGYETVEEAIKGERQLLAGAKSRADFIIDTSLLTNAQLREQISNMFLEDSRQSLLVNCMSFGFKYGLPSEADLVFDVRCLPNPFYVPELKHQTGLDQPVRDYVMGFDQSKGLVPKLLDLIDYLLPLYKAEGKSQLTIAVGCTGGMHRSVVFAQLLYGHLEELGYHTTVNHRDVHRVK